jgi:hypothetical protein
MPHTRFKLLVQTGGESQPAEVTYAGPEYRAQVASTLMAGEYFQSPGKTSAKPLALGFVNETDVFVKGFAGSLQGTGPKPTSFSPAVDGMRYRLAIHFANRSVSVENFASPAERYARAQAVAQESQALRIGQIERVTLFDLATVAVVEGATVNAHLVPGLTTAGAQPKLVAADADSPESTTSDDEEQDEAGDGAPSKQAAVRAPSKPQHSPGRKNSFPAGRVSRPSAPVRAKPKPIAAKPKTTKAAAIPGRSNPRPAAPVDKTMTIVEVHIQNAWRLVAAATGLTMSSMLNYALEQFIGRSRLTEQELAAALQHSKGNHESNAAAYRDIVATVAILDKATNAPAANTSPRGNRPLAPNKTSLTDVEEHIRRAWRMLSAATGVHMASIFNHALEEYIGRRQLTAPELAAAQQRCKGDYESNLADYRSIVELVARLDNQETDG